MLHVFVRLVRLRRTPKLRRAPRPQHPAFYALGTKNNTNFRHVHRRRLERLVRWQLSTRHQCYVDPSNDGLDAGKPACYSLATYFNPDGGTTMTCFTHNLLELTTAAMCGVARSLVECAF